MRGLLFFSISVISVLFSFSQNVEWENIYPNNLALGKALAVDSDNNIISVGNGLNVGAYNEYLYVQKLSPEGNLIWKDSISTSLNNNYHSATWVGIDSNEDIFIVGYRFTLSNQNDVPNAIKVFKYSSTGTLLQNKTISGVFNRDGNTNLGRRNESYLDENGNLYVATAGATSTQSGIGFVLLKFDNNANLLWERLNSFSNVHGLRGMHYNNGKIVLVGTTTTMGTDNKVAVWDQNGNLLWASTSSIPNQTWATDVLVDDLGNTYTLCQNFGTSYNLIELTKYSPSGTVLFSEQFDIQVAATSGRMALLQNGNIVISGTNWTSSGTGKLYVAQVSSQDAAIINSSLTDLPQINNWVYDITATIQGNYYVAGQSDNNGGSPSSLFLYAFSDINGYEWDTFYDAQGKKPISIMTDINENIYVQIENKHTVVKFGNSILLSNVDNTYSENYNLYPNPVILTTTLEFWNQHGTKVDITIYDELGRAVLKVPFNEYKHGLNKINIDLSEFKRGLYFCKILNDNNFHTFKLIKN